MSKLVKKAKSKSMDDPEKKAAKKAKKAEEMFEALYKKELDRAIRIQNRKDPEHQWTIVETKERYFIIDGISPGETIRIYVNVSRIQVAGMRGEGATFVFQSTMFLPYCHYVTGQLAGMLLAFLKRKPKTDSLNAWVNHSNEMAASGISTASLKTDLNRLCADLGISFGERPSKLYRRMQKVMDFLPVVYRR